MSKEIDFYKGPSDVKKLPHCPIFPINLCEVKALLKYATDSGLDSEGLIVAPLYKELHAYEELLLDPETLAREVQSRIRQAAVSQLPVAPEGHTKESPEAGALDGNDTRRIGASLLVHYSQLTELTKPVTGRTVLNTEGPSWKLVWPLYLTSWIFLLLVVTNEVLAIWLGDMPEPEDGGWPMLLIDIRRYVLEVCEPFIWGALGSCVYLLKRLLDFAEARCYDSNVTSGWTARILLGGILGGVVQFIYDPSVFTSDGLQLKAGAIGFLTGVSVKVVYGAIEKTVSVLAEKLNLDNVVRADRSDQAVRVFLAKELARSESKEDPARKELILSLLAELRSPKSQD